jgi:hypothetical protein
VVGQCFTLALRWADDARALSQASKASFDIPAIRCPCSPLALEEAMKYIAAFVFAVSVLSGQLSAKTLWEQISETAPRSAGVFEDLNLTAPRSVFETLNDTAPRSDGVFGELENNAP